MIECCCPVRRLAGRLLGHHCCTTESLKRKRKKEKKNLICHYHRAGITAFDCESLLNESLRHLLVLGEVERVGYFRVWMVPATISTHKVQTLLSPFL